MRPCGRKFIAQELGNPRGAVTIVELLTVLALSMILLSAVLSGQTFVNRLAHRFFTSAALENEGRLLLQMIEQDIHSAESFIHKSDTAWEFIGWTGEKTIYRYSDSTLWRNDGKILPANICLQQFKMVIDSSQSNTAVHSTIGISGTNRPATRIRVDMRVKLRGRTLDFAAVHRLWKRAPGS